MKTLKYLPLAIISLLFAGCGSEKPEDVATDFMYAITVGDAEKAASYCTPDTKGYVGFLLGEADTETLKEMKKSKPTITVESVKYGSDSTYASCKLLVTTIVNGEEEKDVESVDLELVDGKWMVDLSK